ncbi:MAG: hypothetical protein U0586_06645 [Candidatus Brocadiaceae bacterium]
MNTLFNKETTIIQSLSNTIITKILLHHRTKTVLEKWLIVVSIIKGKGGKKLSSRKICYVYLLRGRIEVLFKELK